MRYAYSDKEIIKSYMENPTEEQIQILTELNSCYKSDIIHLLQSYGIKKENSRKRIYVDRVVYKENKLNIALKESNITLLEYVKKRRKRLEFLCLTDPCKQRKFLKEMQELMRYMDECNRS